MRCGKIIRLEGYESRSRLKKDKLIPLADHGRGRALLISVLFFAGVVVGATPWLRAQSPGVATERPQASRIPESTDFWSNRGRWTFGAQLGFALENDIPHNISHIAILIAQPNVGLILRSFNTPRFPVSRFSVVSEGILGGAVHPGGRLLGNTLLFRLDGKPIRRVVPFFNFGAGVMNTTLSDHAPELSGHTQFSPQGGPGIQYFFSPQRALVFEYRYLHVSNNGLEQPNPGFNGSMITLGFRWLRRPRPLGAPTSQNSHGVARFLFGKD